MVKTTTVESFQATQTDEQPAPSPLAALAERMVRDRSDNPESGDPFAGMAIEVDPGDAFGLVQGKVRQWVEDNNRWATEIEIRHKADQLIADAEQRRPVQTATYTVGPDGLVSGFTPDAPRPEAASVEDDSEPAIGGLRVPRSTEFDADGWADSTALWQRAQTLIERHPDELEHLAGMTLGFLWKLKGGKSRGRPVMGQCVKTGGLLKHFATSTFLVWLAADHVLAAGYGDREIEALLFRQLLAAGITEVDENTGRGGGATVVPPDVQAYAAELRVYGLWESQLKSASAAFRQAGMWEAQPSEFERQEAAGAVYSDDEDERTDCRGCSMEVELNAEGYCAICKPALLACSVCNAPITGDDAPQYDLESPVVVLCEACGEDGVIEGDE